MSRTTEVIEKYHEVIDHLEAAANLLNGHDLRSQALGEEAGLLSHAKERITAKFAQVLVSEARRQNRHRPTDDADTPGR